MIAVSRLQVGYLRVGFAGQYQQWKFTLPTMKVFSPFHSTWAMSFMLLVLMLAQVQSGKSRKKRVKCADLAGSSPSSRESSPDRNCAPKGSQSPKPGTSKGQSSQDKNNNEKQWPLYTISSSDDSNGPPPKKGKLDGSFDSTKSVDGGTTGFGRRIDFQPVTEPNPGGMKGDWAGNKFSPIYKRREQLKKTLLYQLFGLRGDPDNTINKAPTWARYYLHHR